MMGPLHICALASVPSLMDILYFSVILETDPQAVAQRVSLKSEQETPISEQTISQLADRASDAFKKFISN